MPEVVQSLPLGSSSLCTLLSSSSFHYACSAYDACNLCPKVALRLRSSITTHWQGNPSMKQVEETQRIILPAPCSTHANETSSYSSALPCHHVAGMQRDG